MTGTAPDRVKYLFIWPAFIIVLMPNLSIAPRLPPIPTSNRFHIRYFAEIFQRF